MVFGTAAAGAVAARNHSLVDPGESYCLAGHPLDVPDIEGGFTPGAPTLPAPRLSFLDHSRMEREMHRL